MGRALFLHHTQEGAVHRSVNIYLQIGIGLLPGAIGTVFFLLKRRAFNFGKICMSLGLLGVCGMMMGTGIYHFRETASGKRQITREQTIQMANAMAAEGAYGLAGEVISEYGESFGYDEESRLLHARIAAMNADYQAAAALYQNLLEETGQTVIAKDSPEIRYVEQESGTVIAPGTDVSEAETRTETSGDTGEVDAGEDDLPACIRQEIQDQYKLSDDLLQYAKNVDQVLNGTGEESKGAEKRVFRNMMQTNPEYADLECVSKAKTKIYVITGNYGDIIKELDENSSYHEWITASELYLNGLVSQKDFPEEYQKINKADLNEINSQLRELYKQLLKDQEYTKQELADLKKRIDAVSSQTSDQIASVLKGQLSSIAEEDRNREQSKTHLELSKIENSSGNETAMGNQIDSAIRKAPSSQDSLYKSEMSKLNDIISKEDSNLNNLTSIPNHVTTIIDNSLTIDVKNTIYNPSGQTGQSEKSFEKSMTDHINAVRASVIIGKIDASGFPTVQAAVCIDNENNLPEEELKKKIRVYDCGNEITDYKLEKIQYSQANLMLLCDVSGSMERAIGSLRRAAAAFVENCNSDERIGFAAFSNYLEEHQTFESSNAVIMNAIQNMEADGGTELYRSIGEVLKDFPANPDVCNILIAMTDGRDNNSMSGDVLSSIASAAREKGVSIYTLGLGVEIDAASLQAVAKAANGEFMYLTDESSLSTFFNKLHAQTRNQYRITYEGKNSVSTMRELEISMPEANTRDKKTYYAGSSQVSGGGTVQDDPVFATPLDGKMEITGIMPRSIRKTAKAGQGYVKEKVYLKGSGFTEENKPSVTFKGTVTQEIDVTYIDEETCQLLIPADMAVGSYWAVIKSENDILELPNAFYIEPEGGSHVTTYGAYTFTAYEWSENNGVTVLNGNVTMNGWLHFKGEVTLQGDLNQDARIQITDNSGSYITLDSAAAKNDFAKKILEKGISMEIPALGAFHLYNDILHSQDAEHYQVDMITPKSKLDLALMLVLPEPQIQVYPDALSITFYNSIYKNPLLTKVISMTNPMKKSSASVAGSVTAETSSLPFEFSGSARLSNQTLGIKASIKAEDEEQTETAKSLQERTGSQMMKTVSLKYPEAGKILNAPVQIKGVRGSIDTAENELKLGADVSFEIMDDESALGFDIKFKSMKMDGLCLKADLGAYSIKIPTTPLPLSVTGLSAETGGVQDFLESGELGKLELSGGITIETGRIRDVFPRFHMFDDVSLLKLDDATIKVKFSPFSITGEASVKLLDEVELLSTKAELGTFDADPSDNSLLQIHREQVKGLSIQATQGIKLGGNEKPYELTMTGTGKLSANSAFTGLIKRGTMIARFTWWKFKIEENANGEVACGFYQADNGEHYFVVIAKGMKSDGKTADIFLTVDKNAELGGRPSGMLPGHG